MELKHIKEEIANLQGLRSRDEITSYGLEKLHEYIDIVAQLSLQNVSETLLIKYMRHVRDCEGIDFVEYINSYKSDVIFTDEEEQALIEYSSR